MFARELSLVPKVANDRDFVMYKSAFFILDLDTVGQARG